MAKKSTEMLARLQPSAVKESPRAPRLLKNNLNTYDVILADPPWSYRAWSGKKSRTADAHYRTMSTETIADLPISRIVNENAALFLWSTPPAIHEAIKVVEAWGFQYKTFAFVWIKHDKHPHNRTKCAKEPLLYKDGELFGACFGLGHYTRANSEICLLGIRGRMPVAHKGVSQLILSQRRDHSWKPDEQYERIERLYPKTTKLELFARRHRSGWDVLGLEIDGRDVRKALLRNSSDEAGPLHAESR